MVRKEATNYKRLIIIFPLVCVYTLFLWGKVPFLSAFGTSFLAFIEKTFGIRIFYYPYWILFSGVYFFLIPLFFGRIFLKLSFRDMGFQIISVNNIKPLFLLYFFSLPVLIWLARQGQMYTYYDRFIKGNLWGFLFWSNLLMFFEHSFINGILISILEPTFFRNKARELAISKEDTKKRINCCKVSWGDCGKLLKECFCVDRYYFLIFILDGIIFTLIHIGKPSAEVLLAFPGGVFLALMAFHFKSFLPCYLIHVMTAGTIITIVALFP